MSYQPSRSRRRAPAARALAVVFGTLAAIFGGVVVLFTVGDVAAVAVFIIVLGGAITASIVAPPAVIRSAAALVFLLFVASGAFIAQQAVILIRAFTETEGPALPADPVKLAAVDAKFEEITSTAGFRLELLEDELTAMLQDGLAASDVPLRRVTIDIVDGEGDKAGRVDFDGEFKSGGLSVEGSVTASLEAGAVRVDLLHVDLGALSLPGIGEKAIEDLIDSVADLNQTLAANGATVQSIDIGNDRVVITGTQAGGDLLTSTALLTSLRDQAAALGTSMEPPAERFGPGVIDATTAEGPAYYVALGDSLAANVGVDRPRDGYVSRFHNQLQLRDGATYGLRNFGVSGETSGTLLQGGQLGEAITFMQSNTVSYVTIDIGANDLLGHLGSADCADGIEAPACRDRLASTFDTYGLNLSAILDAVRDAAPDSTVIFLTAYNPFSLGFGGSIGLEESSTATLAEFNDMAGSLAAEHGIIVADGFNPMLNTAAATTHMLDQPPDIHPLAIGYDILAGALLDALANAGG